MKCLLGFIIIAYLSKVSGRMSHSIAQIAPDDISKGPYIFVSYSRSDVYELHNVLQILRRNHFRFWYDQGLKSGENWAEELGNKINRCTQVIALISNHAVQSKYVKKEIGMAINRGKNMMVIYLSDVQLSDGLHLLLDDIQAIYRGQCIDESDFERKICEGVDTATFYSSGLQKNLCDTMPSDKGLQEFWDNYKILSKIRDGGTSQVYLAKQKRTDNWVAVKYGKIDQTFHGKNLMSVFQSEKEILSSFFSSWSPYVPVLLDWYQDDETVLLVEPYIQGECMQDVPTLSELEAVMVAQKVLSILRELHSLQIVHGDIKPANLIQQENGAIYLIDFGSAIFKGDAYRTYTFGYTAPECSAQTSSSPASDIYSLGRTIEYLLIPWDHRREIERQSTKASIRFYRSDISVELEGILDLFTNPEPYLRPQNADAALELLNHYKTCNPFKKIKLQFTSHKKINTYCAQQQKRQEVVIRELDNITQSDANKTTLL